MALPTCELGVNVDHVATLRQARRAAYPDPVIAASFAELGGADQITVHLRGDRRHINERDLRVLKETCLSRINLEIAATDEMIGIALELEPHTVTLVPERPEELTTEGGLDVIKHLAELRPVIQTLRDAGIIVALFVPPEQSQVEASKEAGAQRVEIHTGIYCDTKTEEARERELQRVIDAAQAAARLGLGVVAGHGLNYDNVGPIAAIPEMEELNIGHAIVARSTLVGMEQAVRDMVERIARARR